MKNITINIPERYIEGIEKLIDAKIYHNRSATIRDAIRNYIENDMKLMRLIEE